MEKTAKVETRRIEVLFQHWVSEDRARRALKRFGLTPQSLAGHFGRSVILKVIVPADEVKEWIEKLEKDHDINAVRD